jgi:hypothetical protein
MTVPGIDYITALTIVSEIVDIQRFSTPWKLVGYAGLNAMYLFRIDTNSKLLTQ